MFYIIQNKNNEIIIKLIDGKPCVYLFTNLLSALQFSNSNNKFVVNSINNKELNSLLDFCNQKFIRYVNVDNELLSISEFKKRKQEKLQLLKQQLNTYLQSDEFDPFVLMEGLKLMNVFSLVNELTDEILISDSSIFVFTDIDFSKNITDLDNYYVKSILFVELIDFCINNEEIKKIVFNKNSKGFSFTFTSNFIKSNNN